MAHLREDSSSNSPDLLLDQYDIIHVLPEKRDTVAAMDSTVGHQGAADHVRILIEAKIGDTPLNCQEAAKQAHRELLLEPRTLAFAICYQCQLRN